MSSIEEDLIVSLTQRETNVRTPYVDLELVKGDITKLEVDAIVNAAHDDLTGGGGVDSIYDFFNEHSNTYIDIVNLVCFDDDNFEEYKNIL